MILTLVAVGVAGVVVGAIVKHGSVAAAEASAKKEIADIKAEFAKIEAAAKVDEAAIVAKVKALFAKL